MQRKSSSRSLWCGGNDDSKYKLRSSGPIKAAYVGLHPRRSDASALASVSRDRSSSLSSRVHTNQSTSSRASVVTSDSPDLDTEMAVEEDMGIESDESHTVVALDDDLEDIYVPEEDEVPETSDLIVPFEAIFDDDDDDDDDDKLVPMRALTAFTIYRRDTRQLIPFTSLLEYRDLPDGIAASGFVAAWIQDEEHYGVIHDKDQEDLHVILSDLTDINMEHVQDNTLDSKVYIATEYAWYILDVPSAAYTPHYSSFWIGHHLFNLAVSLSTEDTLLDLPGFMEEIDALPAAAAHSEQQSAAMLTIGRELSQADFAEQYVVGPSQFCLSAASSLSLKQSYISDALVELFDDEHFMQILKDVPLIRHLLGKKLARSGSRTLKGRLPAKSRSAGNGLAKTVVTWRVRQYARGLFIQPMQVVGEAVGQDPPINPPATFVHVGNHSKVRWGEELVEETEHYRAVTIDGVRYQAGDAVICEPGLDDNAKRAENSKGEESRGDNQLANDKWFAKICYFFEEDGQKKFHAQWYQAGVKTLLQQTAHPQELFLTNECHDVLLDCILQKCNLKELLPSDEEPAPNLQYEENDFFTGQVFLTWDYNDACFMEVSSEETEAVIEACEAWQPCYACGLKILATNTAGWIPLTPPDLPPVAKDDHQLYQIAQISELYMDVDQDGELIWHADLRVFHRYSVLAKGTNVLADERRLYLASSPMYWEPISSIDGKIYVVHSAALPSGFDLEEWVEHDDHFYVDSFYQTSELSGPDELLPLPLQVFKACQACHVEHLASLEEQTSLSEKHSPLRGLELFAGAGGLSTGLNLSGFVDTKWAVEFEPYIAATHQANHPDTIVYNQDSNVLLKHAVQTFEGLSPEPLKARDSVHPKILPPMPQPEEVDFIYGGPPCQSFSGMNHNKRDDDPRSTMACNMLSYVEFYKPSFFLLENVKGMVHHKLTSQSRDLKKAGSVVTMGVIKFILRSLIGLGYQARFKLLQAGQYGSPQNRLRVIFWGARRELPLPKFPMPTHFFEPTHNINLSDKCVLKPAARIFWIPGKDEAYHHQCAPMPPVTAMDAISDLPPFDWINPHRTISRTAEDKEEAASRRKEGIAQLGTADKTTGYDSPVSYSYPPLNRYQLLMRHKMGKKSKVKYHWTPKFNDTTVERVVNIPLGGKYNHADLPPELATGYENIPKNTTLYGRIEEDGHFRTALTTMNPAHKGGNVLHPTQKRILTVRECARSQGFPDHYKFVSYSDTPQGQVRDQLKQIGNAVPIPLGMALGRELGKALFIMWKRQDDEEARERANSPEAGEGEDMEEDDEQEEEEEEEEEDDGMSEAY
ncbi:hypothetical protein EIP91_000302 [Steccherinum ochraceum]|uniref:Cytosine-specific methyltransferase n=1 Tax=Steccherinum ochraceum TaxID=92696 RepID=A0A4R0RFZ7_9APHY|nr:hypothetical protein EIP91_000302 [Steccherinum ochraceum]